MISKYIFLTKVRIAAKRQQLDPVEAIRIQDASSLMTGDGCSVIGLTDHCGETLS